MRIRWYLTPKVLRSKLEGIIKLRLTKPNPHKIIIAGWEASGSTFLYQVVKLLGLQVEKIHGKRSSHSKDFTLFPFRDPRDVICSNAKRASSQLWKSDGPEAALLKELERFVENRFAQSLYESTVMPNVILIRYESYFLQHEQLLISFIADQFMIPLDYKQLKFILEHTSIEANIERSRKFKSFDEFNGHTGIHGSHISNEGMVGQWRQYFTPVVVHYVKTCLGDLLIDLGYEKSVDWSCD